MDFFELVHKRYSARAYKPDAIADDVLNQILEAGRIAPSAHNNQPFQILVIHTEGKKAELSRIYTREWFVQGPLILAVCAEMDRAWVRASDGANYAMVDVGIVMDHMTLAATACGLGTCWIANFNPQAAKEVLGLPANVEPIVFTPLGYATDQLRPKVRKALNELVHYEKW